jgi:hypothetical protein
MYAMVARVDVEIVTVRGIVVGLVCAVESFVLALALLENAYIKASYIDSRIELVSSLEVECSCVLCVLLCWPIASRIARECVSMLVTLARVLSVGVFAVACVAAVAMLLRIVANRLLAMARVLMVVSAARTPSVVDRGMVCAADAPVAARMPVIVARVVVWGFVRLADVCMPLDSALVVACALMVARADRTAIDRVCCVLASLVVVWDARMLDMVVRVAALVYRFGVLRADYGAMAVRDSVWGVMSLVEARCAVIAAREAVRDVEVADASLLAVLSALPRKSRFSVVVVAGAPPLISEISATCIAA